MISVGLHDYHLLTVPFLITNNYDFVVCWILHINQAVFKPFQNHMHQCFHAANHMNSHDITVKFHGSFEITLLFMVYPLVNVYCSLLKLAI